MRSPDRSSYGRETTEGRWDVHRRSCRALPASRSAGAAARRQVDRPSGASTPRGSRRLCSKPGPDPTWSSCTARASTPPAGPRCSRRLPRRHHVVAPDLPGHGESEADGELGGERVIAWLDDVIATTCAVPPVVVGRVLGGAIAMRYAVDHGDRVGRARARRHARTVGVRTGAAVRRSAPALPRRPDQADPGPTDAVLRPRLSTACASVSVIAGRPTPTTPSTASNNRRGWRLSGR